MNRLGTQSRHGSEDPFGIEQIDRARQGHRALLDGQRNPEPREPFERIIKSRLVHRTGAGKVAAAPGPAVGQGADDLRGRVDHGRGGFGRLSPSARR